MTDTLKYFLFNVNFSTPSKNTTQQSISTKQCYKRTSENLYYFWVNYATILQKSNQPKEAVKILHNALATVDFSEEDKKRVQTTLDSIVREIAMAPKSSKSPSPTHNNIPQNPELSQPTPKKETVPLSSQTPKVSNLVTLSTPASKYTPLHERPEFHSLNRRKPRTLNRFPSKFQTGPERIRKSSGDSTNSSGISDIDVIEPPTDAPSHNQTTPNNQPPPSSPSRSELSTEQAPQPPPPKSPQQSTPKATQSQPQPPKSPMPNSGSVMASPAPSASASNNTPSKDQAVSKTPRQATPSKDTSLRLQELVVHGRKYHCLGIMGKGGSSRVIKAIGGRKMDLFAIKQVDLTDQDEQTCEGFRNEINLLCSLKDESHIVHLFDYEITNKRLSLVLELGEIDLRHLLHRLKKQSPAANRINYVKLYWQQMLEAVQVIHKKRIVHGDLKPANFVSFKGVLKLIDFGIAGAIQSNTTNIKRDSMIGTLNYIAPEALDLKPNPKISMGVASDVWSMGIILYEMAYHTTPFASISNMLVKVQTIVSENHIIDFPDIGQPLLVQVLQSCLQRNPKKRATISQLLAHPFLA